MVMLGKTVVGVVAQGANRFKRDMTSCGNSVKRFAGFAKTATKALAGFGVAGAMAAAGGLAMLTKSSMENIDRVGKLSKRLGMATKDLSAFQYAAKMTGSDSEKIGEGMQELMQRLGEAKISKTGSAYDQLQKLNLSAEELVKSNPVDVIKKLSDEINKFGTHGERAFAWDELMGGDSRDLLNFLTLGSKGISAIQKEADRLGLSFSRIDSAKVEAANNALTRAKSIFTGIGNTLAIQLSPFIESAANKFVDMASSGEGMGKRITNGLRMVSMGIAKAADYTNLFKSGLFALQSGASTVIGAFLNGFSLIDGGVTALGGVFNKLLAKIVNGFSVIKSFAYAISSSFSYAFGSVLEFISRGIAQLEFEAKKVYNAWMRITGKLSDADEIRANNKARQERTARIDQINSFGGDLKKQAYVNGDKATELFKSGISGKAGASFDKNAMLMFKSASDSFDAGLSGEAGKAWDIAAKDAAANANWAYDKFVNGSAQKQVSAFFDSIQNGAQKAAEGVAANSTKMNLGGVEKNPAAKVKTEGRVSGSFSASSLFSGQGKIEKEQLDVQKKMNKNLEKLVRADNSTVAVAG